MNLINNKIIEIKGDASFRKFFRKIKNNKTSIIIYATKEKKKNLLIYDAINRLLLKNKISAPKLYQQNYKKNYIEVEDLGNKTIFDILKKNKNKIKYFKKIINILINIQNIKQRKIKNFKNLNYKIPKYKKNILLKEANLFLKWYAPRIVSKKKIIYFNKKLKREMNLLLSKIKLPNNTFVHRDFHVSNLMLKKNRIYLIDNQDSVIGNKAYDLASLVDDVRLKTSNKLKESIYNYYMKLNKKYLNEKNFKNDFDILSVLRNLKVIGTFARLSIRDNKKNYMKLIPYTWKLIELRIYKNKNFDKLKILLDKFFPKKIRMMK